MGEERKRTVGEDDVGLVTRDHDRRGGTKVVRPHLVDERHGTLGETSGGGLSGRLQRVNQEGERKREREGGKVEIQ